MNHAIAIATRELRERSRLFALAAALACVPFLVSLLPAARANRADVIGLTGAVIAAALTVGAAILLGVNIIGRDLAERRLSFYFSKPISAAALWSGKAAAGLITILTCLTIVAGPVVLFVGDSWRAGGRATGALLFMTAIPAVVLFLVSHAISTMVRSRSPLVALDLVLAAAAAALIYLVAARVAFAGAIGQAFGLINVVGIALVIALAIAPVFQLAHGRTDRRRSHVALSRAFWPAVAVIVIAAAAYAWWLTTPGLEDIDEIQVADALPAGDFSIVSGEARNRGEYQASFVVNRRTGETFRLPSPIWWGAEASRDGRIMTWLEPAGALRRNGQFVLNVRNLETGETRETDIVVGGTDYAVSDDGSRAAMMSGGLLTVYDLPTGRMLASARAGRATQLYFASADVVRVHEVGRARPEPVRIMELDIRSRSYTARGQTPAPQAYLLMASADGARLLVDAKTVVNGRTGQTLLTLPPWPALEQRARMLSDGSVARTGVVRGTTHVQIIDLSGAVQSEIVLNGMRHALIVGEAEGKKLLVYGRKATGLPRTGFVIDLASGKIDRTVANPDGWWPRWGTDPRASIIPANAIDWKVKGRA